MKYFVFLLLLFFAASCHKSNPSRTFETSEPHVNIEDSSLLEVNKQMVILENEKIDLFIQRYGLKMTKTGTGLRYQILHEGNGPIPTEGTEVELQFTTSLLSGEEIYNSKESGPKVFRVAKSEEIQALHEVVQLMKSGSSAYLVIPSHLAYGVSGDGGKIMQMQPLFMKIDMTIKNNQYN